MTNLASVSMVLPILGILYKWNEYMTCDLLSINITNWGCIHFIRRINNSFFFKVKCSIVGDMLHFVYLFISLSIHQVFGFFLLVSIMNNNSMNICVNIFVWTGFHLSCINNSEWKCWIIWLPYFNHMRNTQTALQNCFAILHSSQWSMSIPASLPAL